MKIYFTTFVCLFFLPLLVFGQSSNNFIELWHVKKQNNNERILKNITKLQEVNLDDLGIFVPYLLDVDKKGNIITTENAGGRENIAFLSVSDQYSSPKFIGEGIGGGPEEFRNPKDIKFDYAGNIWVADPLQRRVSIWQPDGILLNTITLDGILPAVIALKTDGFYTMPMIIKEDKLLYRIDKNGHIKNAFQSLSDQAYRSPLYYEGYLTIDQTGLYYGGLASGFLRKYDFNGSLIFSRETIIPVPLRSLKREKISTTASSTTRADDALYATRDIEIYKDKIFCLFSGTKYTVSKFVDVYDKVNGDYLHSFKLPFYAKGIAIADNTLFVLHRYYDNKEMTNAIVTYQLP